jgi:hypothetical protein
MRVGIGTANGKEGYAAGQEVAQQAIDNGKISAPALAIAFCGSNIDSGNFLHGVQEIIGTTVPLTGGSAIGIISNNWLSYTDQPAGIILIEDDQLQIQTAAAGGLDRDERQTGRDLAAQLVAADGDTMLLFFDPVKKSGSPVSVPVMNSSVALLQGIEENLQSTPSIFGGGTLRDYLFSETFQYRDNAVLSQSAIALVLRDKNLLVDFTITHGCSPKDGIYHTITKIDGATIYEIDNRPVVEVINEIYGSEEWQQQNPVKLLTIGVNHGERFWTEYNEEDFLNRLIIGILPDKSGIVLFEPDFCVGDEILFMIRDSRLMIKSARENSRKLLQRAIAEGKTPVWGLYLNCAGRCALFSETRTEEATEVQNVFNTCNIPLFGCYSGVEIAPFYGKSRGLGWTGVLILFSKKI